MKLLTAAVKVLLAAVVAVVAFWTWQYHHSPVVLASRAYAEKLRRLHD